METIEGDWAAFKNAVGAITVNNYQLMYRGQCNSDWSLVSSWHRISGLTDAAFYWSLLSQVHDVISTWTSNKWDLTDRDDLAAFLGFLQHHGFPTPLLDWTFSPYIAAFFAFDGIDDRNPQCDSVALYVFDHRAFSRDWTQVYELQSATPHVSVLQAFSRGNQKQVLQQGIYTLSNVYSQEAHIAHHGQRMLDRRETKATYLWKYVISVKEKAIAMRELRLMGINAMTLFPSVDGVCKHLRDMYFGPNEIGQTPGERMQEWYKVLDEYDSQVSEPDLFPPEGDLERAEEGLE